MIDRLCLVLAGWSGSETSWWSGVWHRKEHPKNKQTNKNPKDYSTRFWRHFQEKSAAENIFILTKVEDYEHTEFVKKIVSWSEQFWWRQNTFVLKKKSLNVVQYQYLAVVEGFSIWASTANQKLHCSFILCESLCHVTVFHVEVLNCSWVSSSGSSHPPSRKLFL